MLILNDLAPLHWALAGLAIAAITVFLQYWANRSLGISTGFENLCALVSSRPYFRRPRLARGGHWRLPFLGGLLIGGALSALLGGGWSPTWELGMFDDSIGTGRGLKLAWMFVGGLLIGFGTRLSSGCTSGHGIFGNATFQRSSLVATLAFMATGILTTNLIYRVLS